MATSLFSCVGSKPGRYMECTDCGAQLLLPITNTGTCPRCGSENLLDVQTSTHTVSIATAKTLVDSSEDLMGCVDYFYKGVTGTV